MNARARVVLAGAIGNMVEWYDFGLYGLLAPVLASQFFPAQDRIASLLGVYAGFAVGFFMRPIGAVVLGRMGDQRGRQFVLVLSVAMMGVATLAVGLLPGYAAIGIWAPVLLVIIRLFQGFSVGGEFVGSVTYLVENAAANHRGLAGSVANLGATVGMLLAAGAAALTQVNGAQAGEFWRFAFVFGGLLAFAGYLLRRHLPEDVPVEDQPKAQAAQASTLGRLSARWPALEAFRAAPRTMMIALLFTCGYGVSNYVIMVFLPTFAREFASVSEATALEINTAGQALALFVVPLGGWISDRWFSRKSMLALAFLLQAVLALQLFRLVTRTGTPGLWIAQLALAALLAMVMGTAPAMLSEQFSRQYRVSGHAFVLNVGIGIAGGSAPLVAVWLIRLLHSTMAPAAYLMLGCAVSGFAALMLHERSRKALDLSATRVTQPSSGIL